jgi:hypothetical protein
VLKVTVEGRFAETKAGPCIEALVKRARRLASVIPRDVRPRRAAGGW